MANQHGGSLEHKVREMKGTSVHQYFIKCHEKEMSLQEVADDLSTSISTIRKWAWKCGIHFYSEREVHEERTDDKFLEMFMEVRVNKVNLLSRAWRTLTGERDHEIRV